MRKACSIAVLAVLAIVIAGAIAAGCNSGGSSSSSSSGSSACADACKILYEGCNAAISDDNGNQLTESQCNDYCNNNNGASCVAPCNADAEQNSDCGTFENCIANCAAGA